MNKLTILLLMIILSACGKDSSKVPAGRNEKSGPSSVAGEDQTVEEGVLVHLEGKGISPSGRPLTYQWQIINSEIELNIENANILKASFIAPEVPTNEPLIITAELTVTDNQKKSAKDTVIVTVLNKNTLPTAAAGDDQHVLEGVEVTLNASGSSDSDRDTLTFIWTQISGDSVTLKNNFEERASFIAPILKNNIPAILVFQVKVSDGHAGAETEISDTVQITVQNGNIQPIANAGDDITVVEGEKVTLDGTNSLDNDEDELSFFWAQVSGSTVTMQGIKTSVASFIAPELYHNTPENLIFKLEVHDGQGKSHSDTVNVIVKNINNEPIADAGEEQQVFEGETVSLDAGGSFDKDKDSLNFKWSQAKGTPVVLGQTNKEQLVFIAPNVTSDNPVELIFQVLVDDGYGGSSKDSVKVIVNNKIINNDPVANAGSDQAANEAETVFLNGNLSYDPDNDNVSYKWVQIGGNSVSLVDHNNAITSFIAPTVSKNGDTLMLDFQLEVQDGRGGTGIDLIRVTVVNVNKTPVAYVSSQQTIDENTVVILDASASSDPDSDTLAYRWNQISGITVDIKNSQSAKASFTAPKLSKNTDEILVFEIQVSDGISETFSTETTEITIKNINQNPVANAGLDKVIVSNSTVTLSGDKSFDLDSDILTYHWKQIFGPSVFSQNTDTGTITISFEAPANSTDIPIILEFELIVSDDIGIPQTDKVVITIAPQTGEYKLARSVLATSGHSQMKNQEYILHAITGENAASKKMSNTQHVLTIGFGKFIQQTK